MSEKGNISRKYSLRGNFRGESKEGRIIGICPTTSLKSFYLILVQRTENILVLLESFLCVFSDKDRKFVIFPEDSGVGRLHWISFLCT